MSDHYQCRCGRSHGNPDGVCYRCEKAGDLTWGDVVVAMQSDEAQCAAEAVDRDDYDSDSEYVAAVLAAAIDAAGDTIG